MPPVIGAKFRSENDRSPDGKPRERRKSARGRPRGAARCSVCGSAVACRRPKRLTVMSELDRVLARIDADLDQSLERLFNYLRIKSISTDPAYRDACRSAAEHLAGDLRTVGFAAEVRPTAGHPVVLAKSNGAGRRVLFYGHYDVQPVDPLDLWQTPPFEPRIATLPDGRKVIVARGAADDKGQVMTFVEACRAWKAVTGALPLAVTLLVEGEEECGSKNLPPFVAAAKTELAAEFALVCDTGM